MKRLRSWAWPDPEAIRKKMTRSPWGGAYWKQVYLRRQAIAQRAAFGRLMPVRLVHFQQVNTEAAPAPAPVVH